MILKLIQNKLLWFFDAFIRTGRKGSNNQKKEAKPENEASTQERITIIEVSENRYDRQWKQFDTDRQIDIENCSSELNTLAEKGIQHGSEYSFNRPVNVEKAKAKIKNKRSRYETELSQTLCRHMIDVQTEKFDIASRLKELQDNSQSRKLLEHHVQDYKFQKEKEAGQILEPVSELKKKLDIISANYEHAVQDYNYLKETKYGNEIITPNIAHSNFYFVFLGITVPIDALILEKCFITTQIDQSDTLNSFLAWFFAAFIAISAHFTGQYIGYKKNKVVIWFASITILVMLFLASQRAILEASITMTLANLLIYGLGTLLSYFRHKKWDIIKAKKEMENLKDDMLDLERQIKDLNDKYMSELNRTYQKAEQMLEARRRFEIQVTKSTLSQMEKRVKILNQLKKDTKAQLEGMEQQALDQYDTYFRNTNSNNYEAA